MKLLDRLKGMRTTVGQPSPFWMALRRESQQPHGPVLSAALKMADADDWTRGQLAAFARVEDARVQVIASDTHLGEPYGKDTTVGQMAKRASKPAHEAKLLHALVLHQRPMVALEMGTCCGVSAAYQSAAMPVGGRLISLELSPILVEAARSVLAWAGANGDTDLRVGDFADTFRPALTPAPDYAFVDGKHDYDSTMSYFHALTDACTTGAMLVFDDIRWGDGGMLRAWEEILADKRIGEHVDLGTMGVVILT